MGDACNLCDKKYDKEDPGEACRFCGKYTCPKCIYKTRFFAQDSNNDQEDLLFSQQLTIESKNILIEGKICKSCDYKFMMKEMQGPYYHDMTNKEATLKIICDQFHAVQSAGLKVQSNFNEIGE